MKKTTETTGIKIDEEVLTMVKKSAVRAVFALHRTAPGGRGNSPDGSNRLAGTDPNPDNGENITSSYIPFTP